MSRLRRIFYWTVRQYVQQFARLTGFQDDPPAESVSKMRVINPYI
jgi:hypothetical protein